MDHYQSTGKPTKSSGYVYGDKWYVDDVLFKDRSQHDNIKYMGNNVLQMNAQIPYPKMLNRIDDFDKYYANKPLLIKERRKIYGY